jgi:Putative metal-binding motif
MHPALFPRGLVLLTALALGLVLVPVRLEAAGYDLDRGVDYRFPPADLSRIATSPRVLPGAALAGGERVEYQAFDGATYILNRFRGRYVAVLLPDSWIGEGKLDEPLIEVFVDRSDLLYETDRELVGSEPGPDGLLNIAVVPVTCGFGCGYVGAKGIEVAGDAGALALVRPELVAGHTPEVISHEMGHNFDVYNAYLGYWGDFAHAWTRVFQTYTYIYSREGFADRSPEDIFRQSLGLTFERYITASSLNWENCLRDGQCSIRNEAWAGTLWRLARLHGPGAIQRYMRFLNAYRVSHPVPASAEAKNDLHVEAMAAGASLNLGCYADAWRWRASAELRDRMASAYGTGNPFCEDPDGDSFSRLSGDCADADPAVRPGAAEAVNGRDDDCDGLVDDLATAEPAGGDFPVPQSIAYPADVTGRITGEDSDRFVFQIPSARKVRLELCPDPDFLGWVFVFKRDGNWLGYQYTGGDCSTRTYDLDDGGAWELSVELNAVSQPGGFLIPTPCRPLPGPRRRAGGCAAARIRSRRRRKGGLPWGPTKSASG